MPGVQSQGCRNRCNFQLCSHKWPRSLVPQAQPDTHRGWGFHCTRPDLKYMARPITINNSLSHLSSLSVTACYFVRQLYTHRPNGGGAHSPSHSVLASNGSLKPESGVQIHRKPPRVSVQVALQPSDAAPAAQLHGFAGIHSFMSEGEGCVYCITAMTSIKEYIYYM